MSLTLINMMPVNHIVVCRLTVLIDACSPLRSASTSTSNRTLTDVDLTATGVTVLTESPFKESEVTDWLLLYLNVNSVLKFPVRYIIIWGNIVGVPWP